MLVFDDRFRPLVTIVSWGAHREEDLQQYRDHFRSWAAQQDRVLVLSDPRAQEIPNAFWRKRFAELAEHITATAPGVTIANAAVLSSALLVGAARAVGWLRGRGEDETHYASTARDAFEWLERQGTEKGYVMPQGAREMVAELDACARMGKLPSICS